MFRHENEWWTVTAERSPEKDKKIADAVYEWFREADMFHGESLGQSDHIYIDGPILIMNLAEMIGFNVEYKED